MAKKKYAILILAAGGSKRLGHPKQLVKWNQSTLLNHTLEQALSSNNSDVYVALGGNHSVIKHTISLGVSIIDIPDWEDGMGTSISVSLNEMKVKKYEAIIISVCDQPYISEVVFKNLLAEFERGKSSIVISKYKNSSGPPTLFGKKHYDRLLKLEGDVGAKEIVKNNLVEVGIIQFQKGDIDIDTEKDLRSLLELKEGF